MSIDKEVWYREASYRDLSIEWDEGSLTGYEASTLEPNLFNWLSGLLGEVEATKLASEIKGKVSLCCHFEKHAG